MKNPYEQIEVHPCRVRLGKPLKLAMTLLFIGGIGSVPMMRHLSEWGKPEGDRWLPLVEFWNHPNDRSTNLLFEKKTKSPDVTRESPGLRDHLQAFESGVEDSELRRKVQRSQQLWITRIFGEGNRKVIVGREGWLYYQAGVDAVTGRGPFQPEPDSVTRDPDRPVWKEALPVIGKFAGQLRERNIDLMLVPVPVKTMIQPQGLGVSGPVKHPDQDRLYTELRGLGIEVIDLFDCFAVRARESEGFLRQDTHWKPELARLASQRVSDAVREKSWFPGQGLDLPEIKRIAVERSGQGDLVGMLALPGRSREFDPEPVALERVIEVESGVALGGNLFSPISVLGDSFVNIYEDPGLGFGDEADPGLVGGGFASHLSAELGLRLHVIAINGEGATGVRRAFAALPDNVVRSRKLVIWVLASRDLLLSESPANRAGVIWRDVVFNDQVGEMDVSQPGANPSQRLILSGVLREKSAITDPGETPYAEAIYSAVFGDLEVESGEYFDEEAFVFLWAFQNRKLSKTAGLELGKRYRLTLTPLVKEEAIARKTQLDDITRFDIESLWAVEVEQAAIPGLKKKEAVR